jgi:hypothetical protein
MSSQSRRSERAVRTKRSAIAFAVGARTGVPTIASPSLCKRCRIRVVPEAEALLVEIVDDGWR